RLSVKSNDATVIGSSRFGPASTRAPATPETPESAAASERMTSAPTERLRIRRRPLPGFVHRIGTLSHPGDPDTLALRGAIHVHRPRIRTRPRGASPCCTARALPTTDAGPL